MANSHVRKANYENVDPNSKVKAGGREVMLWLLFQSSPQEQSCRLFQVRSAALSRKPMTDMLTLSMY
jgi:hypothetical protein